MKHYHIWIMAILMLSCSPKPQEKVYLESWNNNDHKTEILEFVSNAENENSEGYIALEDRIAVFDNDGTLWTEKPLYNHFLAVFARFESLIKDDPSLKEVEPYKGIHNFIQTKDPHALSFLMEELNQGKFNELFGNLVGVPYAGMSVEEFVQWNKDYFSSWKHPKLDLSLNQTTYKPMKELITLLKDHGFQVYIFTADESAFLKIFSEELYGIPPQNVFGSTVYLEYKEGKLRRSDQGLWVNNWGNKANLIYHTFNKRPTFAAGNSNGDFEMLQYVNSQKGPHMSLMVHHTDAERETAYDGHTEKVLPYGKENGYLIVDMKNDWKTIFDK